MNEIIERKLERLNKQYDEYLYRWDKIEDTFSSQNDYITDRLNEIRSNIRLCNEILEDIKEKEIDYKTAYETSFECNKFLSKNYNELDERIDKAIKYINNREEDNTTCSVCSVICSDLLSILRGDK